MRGCALQQRRTRATSQFNRIKKVKWGLFFSQRGAQYCAKPMLSYSWQTRNSCETEAFYACGGYDEAQKDQRSMVGAQAVHAETKRHEAYIKAVAACGHRALQPVYP